MNIKKGFIICCTAVFLFMLTGCGEVEVVPVDKEVPIIEDLSGNEISFEHQLGDNIIVTNYNLGDYKLENWRITDSKSINIDVIAKQMAPGTEILLEHLHADVSIKSTNPQLNGLTQDSMDNSYHGTSQDGFLINEKYSYNNIFAIEGFSKDIIDGWMFVAGDYGSGEVTSKRLTEKTLLEEGSYGSQLTVVYNFLVKNEGETKYHIESLQDRIMIPTTKLKEIQEKQNTSQESNNE